MSNCRSRTFHSFLLSTSTVLKVLPHQMNLMSWVKYLFDSMRDIIYLRYNLFEEFYFPDTNDRPSVWLRIPSIYPSLFSFKNEDKDYRNPFHCILVWIAVLILNFMVKILHCFSWFILLTGKSHSTLSQF